MYVYRQPFLFRGEPRAEADRTASGPSENGQKQGGGDGVDGQDQKGRQKRQQVFNEVLQREHRGGQTVGDGTAQARRRSAVRQPPKTHQHRSQGKIYIRVLIYNRVIVYKVYRLQLFIGAR